MTQAHTSKEKPELLPCPFCNSADIRDTGNGYLAAFCYECEAEGPGAKDWAEAVEKWNRRTPASQAQCVPLSDAEIGDFWEGATGGHSFNDETRRDFVRAIEAAHGITQEKQG